jgi:Ca2+-binding RTX toxin-like protein
MPSLYGGSGEDRLAGGPSNDKLYGGTGADRIWGNGGNDALDGVVGNDNCVAGTDPADTVLNCEYSQMFSIAVFDENAYFGG